MQKQGGRAGNQRTKGIEAMSRAANRSVAVQSNHREMKGKQASPSSC